VTTFATLFIEQAQLQDDKELPKGKEDIVLTDTQCKPN
jgi:hypothetical protein